MRILEQGTHAVERRADGQHARIYRAQRLSSAD